MQPSWKTVLRFLKKLKIKLPYDSASPLLGFNPKNLKLHDTGCLGLVRWEGPGGWYGEVGREEGSGWGACDFFLKN